LIGGNAGISSFFLPQIDATIIGEIERNQGFGGQQWWEYLVSTSSKSSGKKTPFIVQVRIFPLESYNQKGGLSMLCTL
jgi:hypothetical protein